MGKSEQESVDVLFANPETQPPTIGVWLASHSLRIPYASAFEGRPLAWCRMVVPVSGQAIKPVSIDNLCKLHWRRLRKECSVAHDYW